MRKLFNHYRCIVCRAVTVTKHVDAGETPLMLDCLATPGCAGTAISSFYTGPQDPEQQPKVLWVRPSLSADVHRQLMRLPRRYREVLRHEASGPLAARVSA